MCLGPHLEFVIISTATRLPFLYRWHTFGGSSLWDLMLHPCHCTAHISSHLSSFPSSQTFYILLTPSVATKRLLQVSVVSLCTVCSPWDIFNSVFFQYVFDDNVFKKGNKIIFKKVSLLIIMIFYIYIFLYLPNICTNIHYKWCIEGNRWP